MPNRLVLRPLCLVSSLAAVFFFAAEHPSAARPLYKKVFDSEYKTVLATNKTTCTVCHSITGARLDGTGSFTIRRPGLLAKEDGTPIFGDRKSTRLNSSHG